VEGQDARGGGYAGENQVDIAGRRGLDIAFIA
jgi:hypothetical protein